jgi:hypothetical protein
MQSIAARSMLVAVTALLGAASAYAGGPSFTVKCMHTAGPTALSKYGTYHFFLKEGQVKGYACSVPGNPCQIVSRDETTVVFQTPGENPDTMTIDLRTGAISQTTAAGAQSTFACRQVPAGS